jgi:hypothetical protein
MGGGKNGGIDTLSKYNSYHHLTVFSVVSRYLIFVCTSRALLKHKHLFNHRTRQGNIQTRNLYF